MIYYRHHKEQHKVRYNVSVLKMIASSLSYLVIVHGFKAEQIVNSGSNVSSVIVGILGRSGIDGYGKVAGKVLPVYIIEDAVSDEYTSKRTST